MMGVRLNPCFGCPVKKTSDPDCPPQRETMRKRVSGLGLRSATFTCPVLAREMRGGRRIEITVPAFVDTFEGRERHGSRRAKATIASAHDSGFSCIVDAAEMDPEKYLFPENFDPDRGRFRRTMRHSRIACFVDEPDRPTCALGKVMLPGGACDRPNGEMCGCEQNASDAPKDAGASP